MYIIKLDAIDSTNSYLKAMSSVNIPKDFTVVVADQQTQGRGQMGTTWQTEDGKNLTASVFKEVSSVEVEKQFYISMTVALAICKALDSLKIPQLSKTVLINNGKQSTVVSSNTPVSTTSLPSKTLEPQYQLPKATLSKVQRLELLEERFLRGEVTEETYKELKTKIEAHTGEDITKVESEEQPTKPEQQQLEVIEQLILEESAPSTPELVDEPPQQLPKEPEITQPQPTIETQQQKKQTIEEETDEKNIDQKK